MAHLPRRTTFLAGMTAATLLLAACGGDAGGAPADAPAGSARPAQTKVTIASTDAPTPFALQAGRYKFGWEARDCAGVEFTMTGATQGFVYTKKSAQKAFSAIVSDVPEDTYTLAQVNADCTVWTVRMDRIGS